jgi:uncharacterized protein (TIGR00251 family)
MSAPYLRVSSEGLYLSVKVQPRAARNQIAGALGSELKIKIAAPPVDAAANEALARFLADALDCRRCSVRIVRGHTSRHKTVLLQGLSPERALRVLAGK